MTKLFQTRVIQLYLRLCEFLECPTSPISIKSECGSFRNGTGRLHTIDEQPDPHLLYRVVEVVSWYLDNCQCLPSRRQEFEACGCQEMDNPNVSECHEKEGILISYQQKYILSVTNLNQTFSGIEAIGRRFSQLKQASCQLTFSGRTIKQTSN